MIVIGCMLVTTAANAAQYRVLRSDPQALIISMTGKIEKSDPEKLQTIMESNPFAKERFLALNSFGGLVAAGIEMGAYIRNHGVRTVIPEKAHCISACSIVFVAGWDDIRLTRARYSQVQSLLSVHPTTVETFRPADPLVIKAVRTYIEFMETSKKFDRLRASATFRKLGPFKNIELEALGVYNVVQLSNVQEPSKVMDLSGRRKISKVRKQRPRKKYSEKQFDLEKWRRSLLDNSD